MVKNVKVYKKKIGAYKLMLIGLASSIILTGCADGSRALYTEQQVSSESEIVIEQPIEEPNIEIDGIVPLSDVGSSKYNLQDVYLTGDEYNNFIDDLNQIVVNYQYSNLYNIDDALSEYNKLTITSNHASRISAINADELYNVVLENNENYMKDNPHTLYEEVSKKELKNFCIAICDIINYYLETCPEISIDRISCTLSNLKILEQEGSMSNAFVTIDNCLVVSPTMIEIIGIMDSENDVYDILTHEVIHLLQKSCNCDLSCNINLTYGYGFGYEFNTLAVNSLNNTWLYEASAEKCMCNYQNMDPITYHNMIGYMESLSMINLLNDNYNVNDTEHLSFNKTLDDLFTYFDVTTEEEKMEILNMMYSIEIIQSSPSDFYRVYEASEGITMNEYYETDLRLTLKGDLCQTMNKLFYRNLANRLVNENIPLEDVFYLISVYEADLNNHILYSESSKYDYNEELMQNYVNIQSKFFECISTSTGMSLEDIEELYSNYTARVYDSNGNIVNNYDLSWLESDKVSYIEERLEVLSSCYTTNVQLSYNTIQENIKVH